MNARAFFVAADGRPHPPWRILLFLLLCVACIVVVTVSLGPVLAMTERVSTIGGTASAYSVTLALLLAHWMTFRTFDRRPWSFVWLDRAASRPKVLLFGCVLGTAPITIVSLLLVSVGLMSLQSAADGPWLRTAVQMLIVLVPAAFYEELLSRGYLFATIAEWLGRRSAVVLTSVGFGLLHLGNPGPNAMSIGVVILAGIYLAVVLLATQSLYAAWMAHWAWNWMMAAVLHVPVSGLPLARPDYQIVETGPDWITGGSWGPEGGAGAAVGMLAGLAYLWWRSRIRPSSRGGSRVPAQRADEGHDDR
ncbi:MAG: type II CAAX endopeptidase family protein [Gemmatimonadaceae bacterium]